MKKKLYWNYNVDENVDENFILICIFIQRQLHLSVKAKITKQNIIGHAVISTSS